MRVKVSKYSDNSGSWIPLLTIENAVSIEKGPHFTYVNLEDGKFFEYSNDNYMIRKEED